MTTDEIVITIVITMKTTIIQIGNSLGTRLPKAELDKLGLKKGDDVEVKLQTPKTNAKKAVALLKELSIMNGALSRIEDPVVWQREVRKDRPLPGRS